jgi:drug/metabolite transporter (DMT)-like permease
VSLAWGLTWPALKIALDAIPPLSMRAGTCAIGAAALFAMAMVRQSDLRMRSAVDWVHVTVAGLLNVGCLGAFSAFAQVATTTSRVTVLTYTMPIWAALLAYLVLGERLTVIRGVSLLLCASGLAVLAYPLAGSADFIGVILALATALSWAAGTVYLKWARLTVDPLALAAWQVTVALAATMIGALLVEGSLQLLPAPAHALAATVFAGLSGSAIAYLLWFEILRRLPAITASLAVLAVPVISVLASAAILGERPTLVDIIGFTLILGAAACVLLAPTTVSIRSR